MNTIKLFLVFLSISWITSCKQIYDPPLHSTNQSFLVVEGNLNAGGPTTISLTRTIRLNDSARVTPEYNAQLTIEGRDNSVYPLADLGNGSYSSNQLNINVGQDYRLHIHTLTGKEYFSDYVTVKNNPPIDSISWARENKGVTIYANTHDPQNNTKYYRWDYEETYEIHSHYIARYKYAGNGQMMLRALSDYVYTCYKAFNSSNILIGSSAKLQADVIHESPIIFIPNNSERLAVRYSILVRQYTLSKEAYEYFQIMKKNTESLGTIFDPQPSEIRGNIHSVSDPNEQVIGFLTASPVLEKRIFISNSEVPGWLFNMPCSSLLVANDPDSIKTAVDGYMVYDAKTLGIIIVGWYFSTPECVDCTTRGGNLTKPSFW